MPVCRTYSYITMLLGFYVRVTGILVDREYLMAKLCKGMRLELYTMHHFQLKGLVAETCGLTG